MLSIATFVVFIFIVCIFIYNVSHGKRKTMNLPPTPPNKLPIIGHLHQLGTLPHRALQDLAQKHGPVMQLILGLCPTVVVSSSEAAKEIMKTHDLIFCSRPNLSIAQKLLYGKDVAFAPYGEYWRHVRKICILQLMSAKRVQSFRTVREEEVEVMIQTVIDSSSRESSQVVNLSEIILTLTNDIICRVAFGRKYSGDEVGKKFAEILEGMVYFLGAFNVGDYIPWLGWVNHFNGLNARLEKCFQEMDCFLEGVVEEHVVKMKMREARKGDAHYHEYKEDLVDVLLGISSAGLNMEGGSLGKDNIKAIILDMFSAGTDTSHAVLEWAMAELMLHPEMMKRAQEEVREICKGKPKVTEDDLDKMYYLQSIIKETLRLHLPVPLLVPRESTQACKVQGYDIPAKTRVLVNAYAIGRDPEIWKVPDMFEPERFMNSSVDYKGHDFEFIPFGAGRRGCPGITFATTIIQLALSNLLFRFDWQLPAGVHGGIDMAEAAGLVVHKKSPLLLVPSCY